MSTQILQTTRRTLSTFTPQFSDAIQHSLNTPNLFAQFTALSNQHNAINLGQGFPTFGTPKFVTDQVTRAVNNQAFNQYSRPGGHPMLNEILASHYAPLFKTPTTLDPLSNICSFNGAQSGLFNIITSYLNEGDELATIEPFFDAYKKAAEVVGATTVGIPLRSRENVPHTANDFVLDVDELASKLSEKTKLLILNTPHNPTGKVFSEEELRAIAQVVRSFPNLLVVSDEVYEYSTFQPAKHSRFANIDDDMWKRTISVYSAGKTFSCTGWRIGFAIGNEQLIAPLVAAQGVVSFCSATPLEIAVGYSYQEAQKNGYFDEFAKKLMEKQRLFMDAISDCTALRPIAADGGYFLMCDTSNVRLPIECAEEARDFTVAKFLTEKYRVTGIPISPFYSKENQHLSDNVLRFCFARKDEELREAGRRLCEMT
jgi:aspartate/methionine/tyrosine aminotransferase